MNNKIKHLVLGLFGCILTLVTIFVPIKVKNLSEMKDVQFGYPFHFISGDFSNLNTFPFFPRYLQFNSSNEISFINFHIFNFIISFLIVFLVIELIIFILEVLNFKIRNRQKKGVK